MCGFRGFVKWIYVPTHSPCTLTIFGIPRTLKFGKNYVKDLLGEEEKERLRKCHYLNEEKQMEVFDEKECLNMSLMDDFETICIASDPNDFKEHTVVVKRLNHFDHTKNVFLTV